METIKTKYKFVLASVYYQIPVIILAFALGWVSDKFVTQFTYLYNHSITIPYHPFSNLDWGQGWQFLYNSGVSAMTFIIEFIFFGIVVVLLWFITWRAGKNTDENERIRDAKLDELPQRISESLLPKLAEEIVKAYQKLKKLEHDKRRQKTK